MTQISQGTKVDFRKYFQADKLTLIFFFMRSDQGSMQSRKVLRNYATMSPSTQLLEVDIDHFGSPVATQHGIGRVPMILAYDGLRLASRDLNQTVAIMQARARSAQAKD